MVRNTSYEVSDVSAAFQFAERGLGVAIVPDALARAFAMAEKIAILKLKFSYLSQPKWNIANLTKKRQNARSGETIADPFLKTLQEFDFSRS